VNDIFIHEKNISKNQLTIGLLLAVIAGSWVSGSNTNNDRSRAVAQQENNVIRVAAGGGNSTDVKTVFIPQNIEIQAGQTLTWYNPTPVGEPHSVTFFKESTQFPLFIAPFSVPASTEFNALMPSPNLEPLTVTSNDTATKIVIIANARSLSPIVVDSTGQNVTYLPINAIHNEWHRELS
jgi:plastocyanin